MPSVTATPQRRAAPRIAIELPLTFERAARHGRPVAAHTVDLSTGGARVATDRPLKVDEVLRFDLCCDDGAHVCGECRVLREHVGQRYAIRFERVDDGAEALQRLAARPS
ncbi:MAG TPA: PilZ domain-containing protein [Solirubrobacteraceae bacterium]|nr:PilZ domain-containing protein [Solirubrobacteraceae bacterium]